jgi:hypothetical protein
VEFAEAEISAQAVIMKEDQTLDWRPSRSRCDYLQPGGFVQLVLGRSKLSPMKCEEEGYTQ